MRGEGGFVRLLSWCVVRDELSCGPNWAWREKSGSFAAQAGLKSPTTSTTYVLCPCPTTALSSRYQEGRNEKFKDFPCSFQSSSSPMHRTHSHLVFAGCASPVWPCAPVPVVSVIAAKHYRRALFSPSLNFDITLHHPSTRPNLKSGPGTALSTHPAAL